MCPFPSVNTAKHLWNPRLPPAWACCFPLESSTWGWWGSHQNTQTGLCLGSQKALCPPPTFPLPNTMLIHPIGRQAEGAGEKDGRAYPGTPLSAWEQRGDRPASAGDRHEHLLLGSQLPVWGWVGGGERSHRHRDNHSNTLPHGTLTASGS